MTTGIRAGCIAAHRKLLRDRNAVPNATVFFNPETKISFIASHSNILVASPIPRGYYQTKSVSVSLLVPEPLSHPQRKALQIQDRVQHC